MIHDLSQWYKSFVIIIKLFLFMSSKCIMEVKIVMTVTAEFYLTDGFHGQRRQDRNNHGTKSPIQIPPTFITENGHEIVLVKRPILFGESSY